MVRGIDAGHACAARGLGAPMISESSRTPSPISPPEWPWLVSHAQQEAARTGQRARPVKKMKPRRREGNETSGSGRRGPGRREHAGASHTIHDVHGRTAQQSHRFNAGITHWQEYYDHLGATPLAHGTSTRSRYSEPRASVTSTAASVSREDASLARRPLAINALRELSAVRATQPTLQRQKPQLHKQPLEIEQGGDWEGRGSSS
nr:unnamed protein product [Digitaria exilis]